MRKYLVIVLLLCILPMAIFAQDVYLEWADDEYELEFQIPGMATLLTTWDIMDMGYDIYDYPFPLGATIFSNGTYAEFFIDPNGSILKLSEGSQLTLDGIEAGSDSYAFSLEGKLRMVAAKATSGQADNKYTINTGSTVCGVRGTDFVLDSITGNAYLKNGAINLLNTATGAAIDLTEGMGANLFGDAFEAFEVTADAFAELYEEMTFVALDETAVPGYEGGGQATETEETDETADEITVDGSDALDAIDAGAAADTGTETAEGTEEEGPSTPSFMEPVMEWLREYLGFEIGSITINGETYSKAVLQPEFNLGKLGLGLYLPVIYKQNMFDPDDWHHPDGNDEWSFGTDVEAINGEPDYLGITKDVLSDLFLKIKYITWGDIRDDFFFKVGNLDNLTLGHGMLMQDYANDADFPAIRKVGFNLGINFGKFGFESIVTDLTDIEIVGGRIYFGSKLKWGISGMTDLNPDRYANANLADDPATVSVDESLTEVVSYGDPLFLNVGTDLDLSIVETENFDIIAFADLGGMIPWFRSDVEYGTISIPAGPKWETLWDDNAEGIEKLRNVGFKGGVMGSIFGVDWNLEFRYFTGDFKPAFYNATYDRMRAEYLVDTIKALDPEAPEVDEIPYVMGIFGGTEFDILEKVGFEISYLWPWYLDDNKELQYSNDDLFHFGVSVAPDVIPVLGIYGSVYYDRSKFIPTLLKNQDQFKDIPELADLKLFDANTVVGGEIVYPVAPTLDLVGTVSTSILQDEDGNTQYDDNGRPKIVPVIGIETRVHF